MTYTRKPYTFREVTVQSGAAAEAFHGGLPLPAEDMLSIRFDLGAAVGYVAVVATPEEAQAVARAVTGQTVEVPALSDPYAERVCGPDCVRYPVLTLRQKATQLIYGQLHELQQQKN